MKFTSSIAAAIIAATSFASFSLAAPMSSDSALIKRDLYTYFPTTLAVWNIGKNKVEEWLPAHPNIKGYGTTNGQDLTVLATFQIDSAYANEQCELVFDLDRWDPFSYAAGTMATNIFSSLQPATENATGNNRNQELGQFKVVNGGRATSNRRILFPCSQGTYSVEMAPQGQADPNFIIWTAGLDGLKVVVAPSV